MNSTLLSEVGFDHHSPTDYTRKDISLRDGRKATLWLHVPTGHGILDPEFWENRDYYAEEYRNTFSATPGTRVCPTRHADIYRELNVKQFNQFKDVLPHNARYLEIGCSFGGILQHVVAHGASECHCIEPCREDAQHLRERYSSANVTVHNTCIEDADIPTGHFDIAVSFEVLEHTIRPGEFLSRVHSALRPGGIIHLEVPNHHDVLLVAYPGSGYDRFYYHKAHIHYFTAASLKELCSRFGFSGTVESFLMYPFFNHVWWHQHQGPQQSAEQSLATPAPAPASLPGAERINAFFSETATQYETLINELMLGDCLTYQGTKHG